MRRITVVALAATLALNVLPASAEHPTDEGYGEYPMLHRSWSGADWLRLQWNIPTIEGYDRVRVTITNNPSCSTTPPFSATYEGPADTVTFTGTTPDGVYDFRASTLDAEGGNLGRTVEEQALTARLTSVTVDPIVGPVVAGSTVAVTGRITRWDCVQQEHQALPRILWLERREIGSLEWTRVDSARARGHYDTITETPDYMGRVWFEQRPAVNMEYRLVYDGLRDEQPAASGSTAVVVGPDSQPGTMSAAAVAYKVLPANGPRRGTKVRPRVAAALGSTEIRRGDGTFLRGRVWPRHPGRYVHLQRRTDDGWKTVTRRRLNDESRYAFWLRPKSIGVTTLRVRRPADEDNAGGASNRRQLRVVRR